MSLYKKSNNEIIKIFRFIKKNKNRVNQELLKNKKQNNYLTE